MMREMHQARLPYEMFKPDSPIWRTLDPLIEGAKNARQPVAPDNALWHAQKKYSDWMIAMLDGYRDMRDKWQEEWFHAFYGSPVLQAMLGLRGSDTEVRPKPATDVNYQILVEKPDRRTQGQYGRRWTSGGGCPALLYIRLSDGAADERSFALLKRMRQEAGKNLPIRAFKKIAARAVLHVDDRRTGALDAIPEMLARDADAAADMGKKLDRMIDALGLQSSEAKSRYEEMQAVFSQSHSLQGNIEKAAPKKVHALPGRKGHGPRRHI